MLLLLLLLAVAYIQDGFGRKQPVYVWAVLFSVIALIFMMIIGDEFVTATFTSFIMGIYAWIYFGTLRYLGQKNSIVWAIICLVGAVLPIWLSLSLS